MLPVHCRVCSGCWSKDTSLICSYIFSNELYDANEARCSIDVNETRMLLQNVLDIPSEVCVSSIFNICCYLVGHPSEVSFTYLLLICYSLFWRILLLKCCDRQMKIVVLESFLGYSDEKMTVMEHNKVTCLIQLTPLVSTIWRRFQTFPITRHLFSQDDSLSMIISNSFNPEYQTRWLFYFP